MAFSRTLALIPAVILGLSRSLSASGGWFDAEPPHSLAGDLDRLPAKSLGAIILELGGEKAAAADGDTKLPEGFLERIGKEKPEALAAVIDALVAKARWHYDDNREWLPALYDIRDAITAPGVPDAARRDYCQKRIEGAAGFTDGMIPADFAKGDPMRPHLLYAQGAAKFREGDRTECRPWFEAVLKDHADHPRAEGARFLLARCELSASRIEGGEVADLDKARLAAIAGFTDYLKRHPDGRYAADAHGWLGALWWMEKPAEALQHYIVQLEDKSHPECEESAAHMIERVLGRVVGELEGENEAVLRIVARHPRVALAATYFVLNAPEVHPFDGEYDEPAALKQWRVKVLPKLAAAVAAEKARYTGAWALRMRAMLAQAASAEGNQDEALKLTGSDPKELTTNDDLFFAHIVALQRSRKAGEAEKAAKLFLDTFKESPLRAGVWIRRAHALVDCQRAGEAYVTLSQMEAGEVDRWHGNESVYPPSEEELPLQDSAVYPDVQGGDACHVLMETLREYAPLPELEAGLVAPYFTDNLEAYLALREAIAKRWAAREDFSAALRLVKDDQVREDAAKLTATLQKLAALSAAIEKVTDKEGKARAMLALGDAYAAEHAAKYDSPLQAIETLDRGLVTREDAKALGYADPDKELEGRHLLRHATKWWLRAARTAPGTPASAQARLKVLEGMERIAMSSDYDFVRAMETRADEASRQIYDILRKESPGSPEVLAAAYRSFPPCPAPPREPGSLMAAPSPRGEPDYEKEVEMVRLLGGYRALPQDAFGEFPPCHVSDDPSNPALDPIVEKLEAVAMNPPDWETVLTGPQLREWLAVARPAAENAEQVRIVNLLEDLNLFLQHTELPVKTRTAYVQLRLRADDRPSWFPKNEGEPDPRPAFADLLSHAKTAETFKPVMDFVDYAGLYANEADRGPDAYFEPRYPTYPDVEKGCRDFLQKYPKSERREACQILLMRALFRQQPERWLHAAPPPGADDGAEGPLVESDEPFRPAKLLKAIADYEKEFPKPRYAAEVRNFRGGIAWRTGDYGTALDLTIAQLDDMEHKDLRREAAVRLANLFADLADARHRDKVITALKSRPLAQEKLRAYVEIAPRFADHPLRCLGKYVEDRLAAR